MATKAEVEAALETAEARIAELEAAAETAATEHQAALDEAQAKVDEATEAAAKAVATAKESKAKGKKDDEAPTEGTPRGTGNIAKVPTGEGEEQTVAVSWIGAEGFEEYHGYDGDREVNLFPGDEPTLVSKSKAKQLAEDFGKAVKVH